MAKIDREACLQSVDDLREILATIYDSQSVLAGGKETELGPEISLLNSTARRAMEESALDPRYEKILTKYVDAAQSGDGEQAHFFSRMLFSEVVNTLQSCVRTE